MAISSKDAAANLAALIKRVNDDQTAIEIVSRDGVAVLVPIAEWNSIQESDYLIRSRANAEHLRESMDQALGSHPLPGNDKDNG